MQFIQLMYCLLSIAIKRIQIDCNKNCRHSGINCFSTDGGANWKKTAANSYISTVAIADGEFIVYTNPALSRIFF